MNNRPLLIIGPDLKLHGIGGVTMHVQRLRDYLENQKYHFNFKDYKNNRLFDLLKEVLKVDVVHLHVSNPVYQFILVLCCKIIGKRVVMTLHGNYGRFSKYKNFLVRSSIRMADVPILINQKSYDVCRKYNKKSQLIPAFIPPQKKESLQKDIVTLVEDCHSKKQIVVSTNAYNISFDKNGNEIYGIDFLIRFFEKTNGYVLLLSDPSGNYKKKYSSKIENVYIINYPHSYYELLKLADIFVRNTSTDGDALSVKESLFLKKPTLCSDVVDRPGGVQLFKYNDAETFSKCLMEANAHESNIENGAKKLLDIYMNLNNKISSI